MGSVVFGGESATTHRFFKRAVLPGVISWQSCHREIYLRIESVTFVLYKKTVEVALLQTYTLVFRL